MSPVTHEMVDERSLALHRAVAAKLLEDPEILERARRRVHEWLETAAVDRRWALPGLWSIWATALLDCRADLEIGAARSGDRRSSTRRSALRCPAQRV